MAGDILFEKIGKKESILLLRAFDFDVDSDGYILSPSGKKIASEEFPSKYLTIEDAALVPGSLDVIDGTPTSISKFIREKIEANSHD